MKVYILLTRFGALGAFSSFEKAKEYFDANKIASISPSNLVKVLEIDNPDYSDSIPL